MPAGYGGLIPRGDELLNVDLETGKPIVTHINLNTCETRTEEISSPPAAADLTATTNLAGTKPAGSAALAAKPQWREGRAARRHAGPGRGQGDGPKESGGAGTALALRGEDCPAGGSGAQPEPGTHSCGLR